MKASGSFLLTSILKMTVLASLLMGLVWLTPARAEIKKLEVGDYTIVHVGFAITRLDEHSARETLDLIRQLDVLETELDADAALAAEESAARGDK